MDTSAREITFDQQGNCIFCEIGRKNLGKFCVPGPVGEGELRASFERIKAQRRLFNYDAILGLSGGVDSAVVATRAVRAGLRPLAVHVDAGWNSAESVRNVRGLTSKLGLELVTVVIDWNQMRELQLAFLRSGTLNQDIPQDHAFFVSLYRLAIRKRIPKLLSGLNYATENTEPMSWGYSNRDGRHIKNVYSAVTAKRLRNFPTMSLFSYKALRAIGAFEVISPLNYGYYDPEREKEELARDYGWVDYGGKHSESTFTKWFQDVYLIERYGIDKRRTHLSSKILSGLISREEALAILESSPISKVERSRINATVAEKLKISADELESFIFLPHRSNQDYGIFEKSWFGLT